MAQEVQVGPFAQCVHHGVALGRGGEGRRGRNCTYFHGIRS